MPVMDGLAATRCIRESDHSDSKTVPIVAMTANVFEEDVKKSIDGFNRQIAKLKAGEFTDKDLENAKLAMKANLLNTEGSSKKLDTINLGLNSKYGITYANKLYNEIDTITKQEIVDFAEKIFRNPPVYSIAASKDTLENNKDYFKTLEA